MSCPLTPAEALARARRAAPNVTGRFVRQFADADPAEAAPGAKLTWTVAER